MKPCEKLKNWNWKSGNYYEDFSLNSPNLKFYRNYFDCGTYMFDGIFNVVKFPKGMSIYHGSGNLANKVIEFPLGFEYYKEYDMNPHSQDNIKINPPPSSPSFLNLVADSNETIEYLISTSFPISAGWYASPDIGKLYSLKETNERLNTICGEKCIQAYKLKKDIVVYLLDDNYNIVKLLNSPDDIVPLEQKENMKKMFQIKSSTPTFSNSVNPFKRIKLKKNRESHRQWDLGFSKWICDNIIYTNSTYAGYAASIQITEKNYFHLEFIFCNALEWLERDLDNINDWQYNNNKINVPIIKTYLNQLSLYKTTNVNFHSGNLLEHSIWCLLFSEDITSHNILFIQNDFFESNDEINNLIAFTSFIHDIGKMSPKNCIKNLKLNHFIYFNIPTHPQIGYEYLIKKEEIPIYDDNLNDMNIKLNINDLLKAFNINLKYIQIIALVIKLHWEYCDMLRKININPEIKTNEINNYLNLLYNEYNNISLKNDTDFVIFIYILLVVSFSDILASQVYGTDRLLSINSNNDLNKKSKYFPFLTNFS